MCFKRLEEAFARDAIPREANGWCDTA